MLNNNRFWAVVRCLFHSTLVQNIEPWLSWTAPSILNHSVSVLDTKTTLTYGYLQLTIMSFAALSFPNHMASKSRFLTEVLQTKENNAFDSWRVPDHYFVYHPSAFRHASSRAEIYAASLCMCAWSIHFRVSLIRAVKISISAVLFFSSWRLIEPMLQSALYMLNRI